MADCSRSRIEISADLIENRLSQWVVIPLLQVMTGATSGRPTGFHQRKKLPSGSTAITKRVGWKSSLCELY